MNFIDAPAHTKIASHVDSLDGVRGLAVSLVLLVHTGLLPGGNIGVDLFFVLSGYLISTILLKEQMRRGSINLPYFYARRALRLFPAMWIMVGCVTAFVAATQSHEELRKTLVGAGSILLYFFNLLLVSQMPDTSQHQWMFSHVWSLSVEEQFYLVWPILLAVLFRFRGLNRLVPLIAIAGILYPGVARWLLWENGPSLSLYFRTDLRIDGLMCGALIAWLTQNNVIPTARYRELVGVAGTAAAAGFVTLASYSIVISGFAYTGGFTLANILAAILVATLVWYPPWILTWMFEMRWLRWLGKISYGVYLWHWPVFRAFMGIPIEPWARIAVETAASIVIAAISFYAVERHFLKLKHRFET